MVTLVGGTFNSFHRGHEELLRAAYRTGERVIIGVTSDAYVKSHKERTVSYSRRFASVKKFMGKLTDNYEIHPLDSAFGNTLDVEKANLVVSPETYHSARRINEKRIAAGKEPLNVIRIPYVLAEDLFPISSSRILDGELTRTGRRRVPVKIAISTCNGLKMSAAGEFVKTIMKNYTLIQNTDYRTDSEQPFGEDTMRYATTRAMYGLKDNDYSIGIESGIFYNRINDTYYDLHYCAIIDRYSYITTGFGSGFEMPAAVIDAIKSGKSTNQFIENMYGIKKIGHGDGISGLISDSMVTRSKLIFEAVRNAFIPRMRPDIYEREFSP
ncbi:MAG: pantetheine-phosphate adenylyltransferase [Ferroplasma sp.]|uniref:pantetheine-phosphate adenylyltransferase n=1 Tax=Ferroplasma sp. TaxID=2591003 RepID=UPI002814BE1D|nr:pantetheine-phosphate adenylyltransferase [Ferroplasma sp.]WMT51507.1 MAG: pantetheine-phosphate adenylyltransferase [Ferroplasma sp.]